MATEKSLGTLFHEGNVRAVIGRYALSRFPADLESLVWVALSFQALATLSIDEAYGGEKMKMMDRSQEVLTYVPPLFSVYAIRAWADLHLYLGNVGLARQVLGLHVDAVRRGVQVDDIIIPCVVRLLFYEGNPEAWDILCRYPDTTMFPLMIRAEMLSLHRQVGLASGYTSLAFEAAVKEGDKVVLTITGSTTKQFLSRLESMARHCDKVQLMAKTIEKYGLSAPEILRLAVNLYDDPEDKLRLLGKIYKNDHDLVILDEMVKTSSDSQECMQELAWAIRGQPTRDETLVLAPFMGHPTLKVGRFDYFIWTS